MVNLIFLFITSVCGAQDEVSSERVPKPIEGEACGTEENCTWLLMRYNKYDRAFWCLRPDRTFCPVVD